MRKRIKVTTDTVMIGDVEFITYIGAEHLFGIKKSSLYEYTNHRKLQFAYHPQYGRIFLKEWFEEYFSDPRIGAALLKERKRRKAQRTFEKELAK